MPVSISVPRKKHMMCLNESSLSPWDAIGDQLVKRLRSIDFNRYFNPVTDELRTLLSQYCSVDKELILMGNGADEMLYYLFTSLRETSKSFCVAPAPSYFDYKSYSGAVGMKIKTVDLDRDFQININQFLTLTDHDDCKLAIICNPNNPTGNLIEHETIIEILENCDKPVLIDETYFEFSNVTYREYLEKYPNLIIIRSFSKAFSSAGLRFGYLFSSPENVEQIKKVMTVFNLNLLTQGIATEILLNRDIFLEHNRTIISERERIYNILEANDDITVYPSKTNFLVFSIGKQTKALFNYLSDNDIALRDVGSHPLLRNHIRLTVGLPDENELFLQRVEEYLSK